MKIHTETGYFTSFDGVRLYYERHIQKEGGATLVFLHGIGGDSAAWQPEMQELVELGYNAVTLDLRGHGFSDRPKHLADYSLANFAHDVNVFLTKYPVSHPVIIGHSFGGMIALTAAGLWPHLCERLILVDTTYKVPTPALHTPAAQAVLHVFGQLSEHLPHSHKHAHAPYYDFIGTGDFNLPRILSDIEHTSLSSFLMIYSQMFGADLESILTKITVPTLVLVGTQDRIFPPDVAAALAHRIHDADYVLLPGENHIVVINNPHVLTRTIDEFVSSS